MNKKNLINYILSILVIISSIIFIYSIILLGPITNNIKDIIICLIIIFNIIIFISKKRILIKMIMFLYIFFSISISLSINRFYSIINSINKNTLFYSSSLITLNNNSNINSLKDVNNYKIGLLDSYSSIDNYNSTKKIIDDNNLNYNNELIEYDDLIIMLKDLYENKIDLMFISSNYNDIIKDIDGFENINNDIKVITEDDISIKEEDINTNNIEVNNTPFSILLIGIDSTKDGLKKNSYANGDGLMIITFNPNTFNVTMMSIPRDSYVPISCKNNEENKLTHAGWYGNNCIIETIENIFDIDINYYVKINFKGVVSLVNNLGGVYVDVPKRLCTDDSNRSGNICIEKGLQLLNGEEALVLARNRHDLRNGDIGRGYNQQVLVKGIVDKLYEINDIDKILNILDSISYNLDTNFTTDEIFSFYNIYKKRSNENNYDNIDEFLNINQIKLDGNGKMLYFQKYDKKLWCFLLDNDSVINASNIMKKNLYYE